MNTRFTMAVVRAAEAGAGVLVLKPGATFPRPDRSLRRRPFMIVLVGLLPDEPAPGPALFDASTIDWVRSDTAHVALSSWPVPEGAVEELTTLCVDGRHDVGLITTSPECLADWMAYFVKNRKDLIIDFVGWGQAADAALH